MIAVLCKRFEESGYCGIMAALAERRRCSNVRFGRNRVQVEVEVEVEIKKLCPNKNPISAVCLWLWFSGRG